MKKCLYLNNIVHSLKKLLSMMIIKKDKLELPAEQLHLNDNLF